MCLTVGSFSSWVFVLINAIVAILTTVNGDRPFRNIYTQDAGNWSFNENLRNMASGGLAFLNRNRRYMREEPADTTPRDGASYDFIVVGAGTAGATIASRLTEIPDISVLLIEAGQSENLVMDIPLIVNVLQFSEDIDWQYKTETSDTYCLGMKKHQCAWPRGKVMGGSSVLNYMIATRGNRKDYDKWAKMGNDGWSWNDVLPYFKKLETMGVPEYRNDTKYHNFDGPVNTDHIPFHSPLSKAFVEGGLELGWEKTDYDGDRQTGFSYILTTIKNGSRLSSSRAYLHRASNRPNLFVTKKSQATRIIMDRQNNRALGVEFVKGNRRFRVYAKKEVISSAGAIGSPQLLMLSGIGPAQHLRDVGIKPLVDAPVGENLMDHIAYGGLVFLVDQPVGIRLPDIFNPNLPYLADFLTNGNGPMTIPGGAEALGFINVDDQKDPDDFPNAELLFISTSIGSISFFRDNLNLKWDFYRKGYSRIDGAYTWSVYPMLLRPKSRGKILLRDRNFSTYPRLIPNYMSHPEDVRILVKATRAAIAVSRTKAMRKFKSVLHNDLLPGCEDFEYDSDDYWECGVRSFTMNIYHYAGTCKMGNKTDPTAVVDPRLKVIGVQGLRVADASIIPEIMSGHPNIPTFMIAEKLADMVKQDWGYPTDPLP